MGDDPAAIKPPKKGYYRLGAPVRAAIANLCAAAVLVAAVVALFDAMNEWAGTRFCPRVIEALGEVALGDGTRTPGCDPIGER